eukprot:2940787-Rhodomonas_salina.1
MGGVTGHGSAWLPPSTASAASGSSTPPSPTCTPSTRPRPSRRSAPRELRYLPTLSAYARATRCPLLTSRTVVPALGQGPTMGA